MKILYIHNSARLGGMEQHVLDLVNGMVGAGHKVFVWCPEGKPAENYRKAGAEVYARGIHSDLDFKYIHELEMFLKNMEVDVVHAHELKAAVNALLAVRKAKTSVIVTHTHTPISEWRLGP